MNEQSIEKTGIFFSVVNIAYNHISRKKKKKKIKQLYFKENIL